MRDAGHPLGPHRLPPATPGLLPPGLPASGTKPPSLLPGRVREADSGR